jgi:hypothetical protein
VKSLAAIFISILILTSNLGWIQSTHYCLGRPVEANIGLEIAHLNCGMVMSSSCSEAMEQKPGCCHNEFDKFSLDQHLLAQGLVFTPNVFVLDFSPFLAQVSFLIAAEVLTQPLGYTAEEPPPRESQLFIVYQQWLI